MIAEIHRFPPRRYGLESSSISGYIAGLSYLQNPARRFGCQGGDSCNQTRDLHGGQEDWLYKIKRRGFTDRNVFLSSWLL